MAKPGFGSFVRSSSLWYFFAVVCFCTIVFSWHVFDAQARNISTFSDTLSDSAPGEYSNHTIKFTLGTAVPPGGYIEFVPPPEFSILATSTFTADNVELYVNGSLRSASSTGDATTDEITINPGSPGSIRYTFNPTTGVAAGDMLQLRIGDHTSLATNGETLFSTSTGTTTLDNDIGIQNGSTTGSHRFTLRVVGGAPAYADFIVALVDPVNVGPIDTREEIPPFRFNGAPTGDVGGTTLSIEISLETDEFAVCKYATSSGVAFASMPITFENTGLVVHSQEISGLANNNTYTFYVRCIDDEGNFNTDDYQITFTILDVPEGDPNTEGSTEGDGSGTGDDGTGSGGGSGGTSGEQDGGADTTGGSSGGGGGGGSGGGGGTGDENDDGVGGGFENVDGQYPSGDARIIINGYAFPGSDIIILVDGQAVERDNADSQGKFAVTLDEIARGVYTFGVYAVDENGIKSTTFSTSFSVQGGRTSVLSNVNIMPSIRVRPDPATIGEPVTISGFSIPIADITIEHQNDRTAASLKTFETTSDSDGAWSIEVDTSGFSRGTYKVRAKAEQDGGVETDFSDYTYYGVGQEAEGQLTADLNRDGNVNLTDFSILLFHWDTDGGNSNPPADINRDGDVSLTDFSIMLFQWTG